MKNLLLGLLFLITATVSNAQYNAANFTVSNKSYGVAQAVPTDARSFYYDASLFTMRPYQSTAEVCSYLNLTKYRIGNFPVFINVGGTLSGSTFTGGTIVEYWFKDGTTNGDLIVKQVSETDPKRVTGVAITGTSTKTITLTLADATTVTGTFTDATDATGGGGTDTTHLHSVDSLHAVQIAANAAKEIADSGALKSAVNTEITDRATVDALKVDKVTGKQLSTEDYTTAEKTKLAGIATGATANSTDAYLLDYTNHTNKPTIPAQFNPIAGTNVTTTGTYPNITFNATAGGSGTVSSVAMTMPGVIFNTSVPGSPVTNSGTLAPTLATQTANTFLAGPSTGSAATPTFRAVVSADIPTAYDLTLVHKTGAETITGVKQIGDTIRATRQKDVFIGDSWTLGTGASPTNMAFAPLVAGYLGDSILNLGTAAFTLQNMITTELPLVPAYTSNIRYIFVNGGINDASTGVTAATFSANLQKIIDTLVIARGYPKAKIIIIGNGYVTKSTVVPKNHAFSDTAIALAARNGVTGIDIWTAMSNGGGQSLLISDSLHPTNAGHLLDANTILAALTVRNGNFFVGGNIGINTITPHEALEVNGKILSNEDATFNGVRIGRGAAAISNSNTVVGEDAFISNTNGFQNVAVGDSALRLMTTGNTNTAIGNKALATNSTGGANTAIGASALLNNTISNFNTAIGASTLAGNNSGANNTAIGASVMTGNTSGSDNVAIGKSTLTANSTNSFSVAIGSSAAAAATINGIVAIGYKALNKSTTANANTAIGYQSTQNSTTGAENTGIGYNTFAQLTIGATNTAIGNFAGYGNATTVTIDSNRQSKTDSNCTFIGAYASRANSVFNTTVIKNSTAVGYDAQVTKSNQVVLGNSSVVETVLRGVTVFNTMTEPATPAAGTVVEWWDGTNKKWKKPDGTTGIIY